MGGYILQGGDPENTGKGGESIWNRPFRDEFDPTLRHDSRGIVSMANSGPDSNGSQFFITYAKHSHLDNKYTIFARVISGLDTLSSIERQAGKTNAKPITIDSVTLHANPFAQ